MYEKLDKYREDLEKAKKKKEEADKRLQNAEKRLREAEDLQVVSLVRGLNITPEALTTFLAQIEAEKLPGLEIQPGNIVNTDAKYKDSNDADLENTGFTENDFYSNEDEAEEENDEEIKY